MVRIRIQRRHGHVRHHHRIHSGCNRLAKRRKFDGIQARPISAHARHSQVRVGGRVAVSGKMLHRRQHAALMRALDICGDHVADLLRILSKRTRVDDGIRRIRVHVRIRKEIPMHPDRARFQRRDAPKIFRVLQLAVGAEGHRVREIRAPDQPDRHPALEIRRNQQRQLRFALQSVQQFRRFVRPRAQKKWTIHRHAHGKRAHVILPHVIAELQVLRALHIQKLRPAPDHEHLPDLLLQRQLAQRLLRPAIAFATVLNGTPRYMFFLGERRRGKA